MKLACFGSGAIVEKALLRPNLELRRPFEVEVVSRDPHRHADLVEKYDVNAVRRTMDEVLADDQVRAVYIALPNAMHCAAALNALRAKKAVLVEKPLVVHPAEVEVLEQTVRLSGGILMEALMAAHHPWFNWLATWLHKTGEVTTSSTRIAFDLPIERLKRMAPTRSGGGAWYDTAPYWAHFLQIANLEFPARLEIHALRVSPLGFDLAANFRGDCGSRRVAFGAALDRPFQATYGLQAGSYTLDVQNFLRPTIGDSAIWIEVRAATGRSERIKSVGKNYYMSQLSAFHDRVRQSVPFFDSASFARARFVTRIGQSLARSSAMSEAAGLPAAQGGPARPAPSSRSSGTGEF